MDNLLDPISNIYLQYGLLGATVLVLAAVIIWQQKRIDAKDRQIEALQEKRKQDTDIYTASYTAIVKEQVATQRDILNGQGLMQQSISQIATAFQNLVNGKG
jgi:hypothetical protein